ncbi:hypothetical protein ACFL16_00175 [Patescibacteria group bacterium]
MFYYSESCDEVLFKNTTFNGGFYGLVCATYAVNWDYCDIHFCLGCRLFNYYSNNRCSVFLEMAILGVAVIVYVVGFVVAVIIFSYNHLSFAVNM